MSSSTAVARSAHSAPLGCGPLHNALEDARDRANLQQLCRVASCAPADLSPDGIHIDMLRLFVVMRQRGYGVSDPTRPQLQRRKRVTVWLVDVTLPAGGPSFTWAFDTPNTS